MKKVERRTWTDQNGIIHNVIDYYSNARTRWQAATLAIGSKYKEDVEQWLDTQFLIVEEGGTNGRWYVCFTD